MDESICRIVRRIFSCMEGAPKEEKLHASFKRQIAGNRATQKKLELELTKNREQLTKLQLEIGKTLTGDSIYSPEDLSQSIQTIRGRIADSEEKLVGLKDEEEQKKMIACHLFKRIEIGRDYEISVELNMTYQQFCSEWSNGNFLTMIAAV